MKHVLENIKNRKSTFPNQLGDGNIERSKILQLLEAARWAPTHKKTEPWRFIVFEPNLQVSPNLQ